MLRQKLNEALKASMKERNERAVSTIRLILAALKDRDIAARGAGNPNGLSDNDILQLLHTMIRQRRDSIALYESGGRIDLADAEREEIAIIEGFLPAQIEGEAMAAKVGEVVDEIGAQSIKDMGKVMAKLKERFAGQMDFSKVSQLVRERLGGA